MNLRSVITLLLTITLAVTAIGSPTQPPDDPPVAQVKEKITPEEEREAREIAALLTRRWQETEDTGALINEFFVSDFADRLHYEPQMLYFGELKPELLATETSDDMRRHYVAMTNFLRSIFRLYEVYQSTRTSEDEEPHLRDMIPANVLAVLRGNPTMDALFKEEVGETAEGQAENRDRGVDQQADAKSIETIEQLRNLTATLEQANVLLRDHLKTLPLTLSASEMMIRKQQSEQPESTAENNDPLMPRIYILYEPFYGYPAGTRLICLNLLPFHVDLVRVGDHLKVLSIYIQSD